MEVRAVTVLALALLIALATRSAQAAGGAATLVNTTPEKTPALDAALHDADLSAVSARSDATAFPAGVIVWEARGGGGDIDDTRASRLREFVRHGGSLLLTLSADAGTGPFRLADMLPTTAWKTRLPNPASANGPLMLAESDAEFFGAVKPAGFVVPYFYEIRPVSAVERGQARYDRYERPVPYLASTRGAVKMQPAGTDFWTRSLLSREWRIRARGAGAAASPLLLTGRYGAGRVAVFASSAEAANSPAARAFWSPVVKWLAAGAATNAAPLPERVTLPAPVARVDVAKRQLLVTIQNPTGSPLPVHLIGRVLTWERAFVADSSVDATLPASGSTTIVLPLPPAPGATGYQALAYRDAYVVRLGVLSASGADLLTETRATADLRPSIAVSVSTDPAGSRAYPFSAPAPALNEGLGLLPATYAYRPGDTAHVTVEVANGSRNIAPLAVAADESTPANTSVMALNDEAASAEHRPIDGVRAWGFWEGKARAENIVSFTFPRAVNVDGITLVGAQSDYRNYLRHNPAGVTIEADGRKVGEASGLGARFVSEGGRVRVALPAPVAATVVRVRFPAGDQPPRLGDIEIEGWDGQTGSTPTGPVTGALTLSLYDALTGTSKVIEQRPVKVAPGARESVAVAVPLPTDATEATLLRLVARFLPAGGGAALTGDAPVLVVAPRHPVTPIADLKADAVSLGFIVTRGFRNIFEIGTGTQEIDSGWGQPDDLVWAFAHNMKQLSRNAHTQANRLFVSDSDLRHYSTPWRTFDNGEELYDVAAPLLLTQYKKDKDWATAKKAILAHSDRWDTGPAMDAVYSWQDFEAFDRYLRGSGKPGLTGKTREALVDEITTKYANLWNAFHLERYAHDIATLKDAFTKEGKTLVITAQGFPLVPPRYQSDIASVVRGMSDDSSWGMAGEDLALTTGRQMGVLAFAPGLQISMLSQWGYDSALLNNPIWHSPVGTTEPSRRTQYDRAFRGLLRPDGSFTAQNAYGYNSNAGYAYTMNANDYAEWLRTQEKQSLLTPDAPLGAGLVVVTGYLNDPAKSVFEAGGSSFSMVDVRRAAWALRNLHDAGVAVGFSAGSACLEKWPASNPPLILTNPQNLTAVESALVRVLIARGVRVVAFAAEGKVDLPGALFVPLDPEAPVSDTAWGAKIAAFVGQPLAFPSGTAGYGFHSNGRTFAVVEDLREEGRIAPLRYRPAPGIATIHAADADAHVPLAVHKDGDAFMIDVPLRPGGAALVAIEEGK